MLTGTALAQAIPLAAAPLITRLYSPEAIGLQTLFMGWATAASVAATCRYDLAVILPDDEAEAGAVGSAVLLISGAAVLLVTAIAATAAPALARLAGYENQLLWVWLLAPMVAGIALTQLCSAFATRSREFPRIARAAVLNQIAFVASALGIALVFAADEGLVAGKTIGQWVAAAVLLVGGRNAFARIARGASWQEIIASLRKYRQFLVFNTPYSLIGTVSRDTPIFVFAAASSTQAAGFYGLARMALMAPTMLLSAAMSQVFYREAVALKGTPRLEQLTGKLLQLGLTAGAPLFAYCAAWGDVLFARIFGPEWAEAGHYAMLLAPAAWMAIQTGWPERLFEVAMRQDVSFKLQIAADTILAALVVAPIAMGFDPASAVAAFAAGSTLYHTIYLIAIYRISDFDCRRLLRMLGAGWLCFGSVLVALLALRYSTGPSPIWAAAAGLLSSALTAFLAFRFRASRGLLWNEKEIST